MKYFLFGLIVSFCFLSCKKDDNVIETSYNAVIKENFTDPYKQYENIEVDDYIPYTITIEDSDANNENVEYRLTPIYEGQPYHQMLWKDFGIYLSKEDKVTLKSKKYISFAKRGTHYFYIRPLVPGTFKHTYELQKYVQGQAIGEPMKRSISFNAVRIKVFIHKRFDDTFVSLKVDDGENETDTYLSAEGITQSYKMLIRYKFMGKVDRVEIEGRLNIRGSGESTPFAVDPEMCEKLSIEQSSGDSSPFVINYYNVKIENL